MFSDTTDRAHDEEQASDVILSLDGPSAWTERHVEPVNDPELLSSGVAEQVESVEGRLKEFRSDCSTFKYPSGVP